MSKVIDSKEREEITNNLYENLFVEAGAGSGKTTSLVSRMVSMVKSGIDVSTICAITFTKAAAVEFYNRFEDSLSKEIANNKDENEKRLCEIALLNIDSCFMGTIDAFCNMILSENPIEAGMPLNSTIVDEEEYNFLLADEYRNVIQNISKEDKPLLDEFMRFQTNGKNAFCTCVGMLLNRRNYSIDVKDIKDIKKKEDEFYSKYKEEIRNLIKNIMKDDYSYVGKDQKSVACKDKIEQSNWLIFKEWKKRPSAVINFIKEGLLNIHLIESFPYATANFNEYFELGKSGKFYAPTDKFQEILKEYKSIQYDYTLAFVNRCIDLVSNDLIRKGKLSFFDNLLLFRNLLKNDVSNGGELIKRIKNRHIYYLVDEFQDTDPLQSEIVFYLTSDNLDPDFKNCKPGKGKLFIVGDPKQSIYRFRNADVVSYNTVKELFIKNGDKVINLTSNYRTNKKLIEYFNAEFELLFNKSSSHLQANFDSVDYVEDSKNRKTPIIEGVYEFSSSADDDSINVSNIIHNLYDKGYKYSDFMVLTNAKDKLEPYMNQFDNDAIPYEVIGKSVFEQCEPFNILKYVFGAIAYPEDSFYVYKAIKKLFKLSDSHIYSIYKGENINILEKHNDNNIDKLVNFYNKYKNEDIIYIFDKVVSEFDLLRNFSTKHLEYLFYAKELLRSKINNGVITIKDAYSYLNDLIEKKEIEKSLSFSNNDEDDRVLLANVHKVKGLEKRIVILTCNGKKASADTDSKVNIHSSYKDKKNYIIKIQEDTNSHSKITYVETDEYKMQKDEEGLALLYEKDRIAYVAATRACDALFISSNSLSNGKNVVPWGSLILEDDIRSMIIHDDSLISPINKKEKTKIKAKELINNVVSFDSVYKDKTYSIISPSNLIDLIEDQEYIKTKAINNDASLKGTIIHRLMELYVLSGFNSDINYYISVINSEYGTQAYNQIIEKVFNTINNGGFIQDNGFDSDIATILKDADEVYCEVPFAYKENSDIYNGIIDLMYKKNNKWIIIDYKTNFDDKQLDVKYEKQLDAYKKALLNQNIVAEAYIYHINAK